MLKTDLRKDLSLDILLEIVPPRVMATLLSLLWG